MANQNRLSTFKALRRSLIEINIFSFKTLVLSGNIETDCKEWGEGKRNNDKGLS